MRVPCRHRNRSLDPGRQGKSIDKIKAGAIADINIAVCAVKIICRISIAEAVAARNNAAVNSSVVAVAAGVKGVAAERIIGCQAIF